MTERFATSRRPAEERLPVWMREAVQRLLDEAETQRRKMRERALKSPPPGYTRDLRTGRERPATAGELMEAGRLLAVHRDLARSGPRTPAA